MERVRIAVIGNGNLGKWHCEKANDIEAIDFVAMVDVSETAQAKFKTLYPEVPAYSDIADVIGMIDAAIIVTPISTHYELIKILIENDKHIFCEKSATETVKQIEDISKALSQKKDLVFQVGHSERYHHIWSDLEQYRAVLDIEKSSIHINRFGPFRGRDADVSVVEDLLIHDVDLLLYLFKERPSSLTAEGYQIRSDRWDHVNVSFNYKSGRKVTVSTGRNHVRVVRDFELINNSGCLYIDLLNSNVSYASSDSNLEEVSTTRSYPKRDHLYLEQADFVNSILNKNTAVVGIQDALSAIQILGKVIESLNVGKEVKVG